MVQILAKTQQHPYGCWLVWDVQLLNFYIEFFSKLMSFLLRFPGVLGRQDELRRSCS
eukprot:c44901_g1_i1 orf=54-224(-)